MQGNRLRPWRQRFSYKPLHQGSRLSNSSHTPVVSSVALLSGPRSVAVLQSYPPSPIHLSVTCTTRTLRSHSCRRPWRQRCSYKPLHPWQPAIFRTRRKRRRPSAVQPAVARRYVASYLPSQSQAPWDAPPHTPHSSSSAQLPSSSSHQRCSYKPLHPCSPQSQTRRIPVAVCIIEAVAVAVVAGLQRTCKNRRPRPYVVVAPSQYNLNGVFTAAVVVFRRIVVVRCSSSVQPQAFVCRQRSPRQSVRVADRTVAVAKSCD